MQIRLTKKYFDTRKELFVYAAATILIILSSINLTSYFIPKKILGVSSYSNQPNNTDAFWLDFLEKHPSYIPGWVEIGMESKVKEIDPNYIIP